MDEIIKTWLFDILSAINEIEGFFSDRQKIFTEYQQDIRTKRAVERNIEIIGEAINRILKCDKNIVISNARKIVDARNRVIHGYDSISDETIWGIIVRHLPILKLEVQKMLENL